MNRKDFLSIIGLSSIGLSLRKRISIEEKSKNTLVLFVGQKMPESVYAYVLKSGLDCCNLVVNTKNKVLRKDMKNLVLGKLITQYACEVPGTGSHPGYYWITPHTAREAAIESLDELKKLFLENYSDLLLLADFSCETAIGVCPIILALARMANVKVSAIVGSPCDVWADVNIENVKFSKLMIEVFSNEFVYVEKGKGEVPPFFPVATEWDEERFLEDVVRYLKK